MLHLKREGEREGRERRWCSYAVTKHRRVAPSASTASMDCVSVELERQLNRQREQEL